MRGRSAVPAAGGKGAKPWAPRMTARGVASWIGTSLIGAVVVSVVAMMIVPLPTWLVDLLITLNIAVSVTLLLVAAYARDALSVAAFPTLLLLTTLFRLGLNVSTTRLILLQADAGRVVSAFGNFVVRGDYLVGGAVFLILTIVQYVVIARGAERVAEVAARFTLDAMPGKQLAVDADLRSGAIDIGEAQRRRSALGREAQLYGALDGAMRFVKGDAVAGILILVVSMVGGLIIGTLRQGLGLAEAARVYTLLTIGDGLSAQLPALLISTGAGLVVTRVAAEDPDADGALAGGEIARQFLGRPSLLLVVATLLGALGLVPGLPLVPFAVVALAFAAGGLVLLRRPSVPMERRAQVPAAVPAAAVVVAASLAPARDALERLLDETARRVVDDLGLPLAPIALLLDESRPVGAALVRVRGSDVTEVALDISTGGGLAALDLALEQTLRRFAPELLGIDETLLLLDHLGAQAPALVREVVPRRVTAATLCAVLRRLLGEGIGVGDLREILEALATSTRTPEATAGDEIAQLTERARRALRTQITRS